MATVIVRNGFTLLIGIAALVNAQNQDPQWCQAGTECCTIPPCMCGTYVNCISDNCFEASCEICPEGYFCSCRAACARLGGGGFELIEPCPPGHFCPAFSGRPTPCPAGTYLSQGNAVREGQCQSCDSFWQESSEGSASCKLSTMGIIVICCAIAGLVLCCAGALLLRRRKQRKEEALYSAHAGGGVGMHSGYYNQGGAGYEAKQIAADGGIETAEEKEEASRKLTAEEKRQALADRMLAMEEEEDAMMSTLHQKHAHALAAAQAAKEAAKPKRKKTKDPEDDVEVMV